MDNSGKGRVIATVATVIIGSICILSGININAMPVAERARLMGGFAAFYFCCGAPVLGMVIGWVARSAMFMRKNVDL